jgi:hypothetical protein
MCSFFPDGRKIGNHPAPFWTPLTANKFQTRHNVANVLEADEHAITTIHMRPQKLPFPPGSVLVPTLGFHHGKSLQRLPLGLQKTILSAILSSIGEF